MSINTTVILNTHHNALPMCSRSGDTSIDINCGLHVQIRTRLACLDLLHRHHPTHTEAGLFELLGLFRTGWGVTEITQRVYHG